MQVPRIDPVMNLAPYLGNVGYLAASPIISCIAPVVLVAKTVELVIRSVHWFVLKVGVKAEHLEKAELELVDNLKTIAKAAFCLVPFFGVAAVAAVLNSGEGIRGGAESLFADISRNKVANYFFKNVLETAIFPFRNPFIGIWSRSSLIKIMQAGGEVQKIKVERSPGQFTDLKLVTFKALHLDYFDPSQAEVVIIFPPNGCSLNALLGQAKTFQSLGYNVVLSSMGGYPENWGDHISTNEASTIQDVHAVMSFLKRLNVHNDQVIVYGLSLGASLAATAAFLYPNLVKRVFLGCPFNNLTDVAANLANNHYLPGSILKGIARTVLSKGDPVFLSQEMKAETDQMDNVAKVRKWKELREAKPSKIEIFISQEDSVTSLGNGKDLADAIDGDKAIFKGGHLNWMDSIVTTLHCSFSNIDLKTKLLTLKTKGLEHLASKVMDLSSKDGYWTAAYAALKTKFRLNEDLDIQFARKFVQEMAWVNRQQWGNEELRRTFEFLMNFHYYFKGTKEIVLPLAKELFIEWIKSEYANGVKINLDVIPFIEKSTNLEKIYSEAIFLRF